MNSSVASLGACARKLSNWLFLDLTPNDTNDITAPLEDPQDDVAESPEVAEEQPKEVVEQALPPVASTANPSEPDSPQSQRPYHLPPFQLITLPKRS
jgi:hypothetical protein